MIRTAKSFQYGLLFLLPLLAAAFWPRYLSRMSMAKASIHLHAATMAVWFGLLVAQVRFAAIGRFDMHRKFGRFSRIFGPVTLLTAAWACLEMARGSAPFHDRLFHLVLPVGGLIIASGAMTAALSLTHKPAEHARWMILSAIGLSGAGLERVLLFYVPGFESPVAAAHGNLVLIETLCALLLLRSWRAREPWLPYAAGLFGYIVNHMWLMQHADMATYRAVVAQLTL